jgi:ribosome biogenesis GTPase
MWQCVLKGLLKKGGESVMVGDHVTLDNLDAINQTARITGILPRTNQLDRPKIANIQHVLVVTALEQPPLSFTQIDRYLTHVWLAGLTPWLVITKADLSGEDPTVSTTLTALYTPLGVPVFMTSIHQAESIACLFERLHGTTSVLAGLSGAGKSSLLNAWRPDLSLTVGEVSEKLTRGRHTTRHVALLDVAPDTWVADTPGFSHLTFDRTTPSDLEAAFPDFAPWRVQCHFPDCLHMGETGCAVGVHLSNIAPSRYESYRAFQAEAGSGMEMLATTPQKDESGYKILSRGKQQPDTRILKLSSRQREVSRRTRRQQSPMQEEGADE